jgi:hypothetical protein
MNLTPTLNAKFSPYLQVKTYKQAIGLPMLISNTESERKFMTLFVCWQNKLTNWNDAVEMGRFKEQPPAV